MVWDDEKVQRMLINQKVDRNEEARRGGRERAEVWGGAIIGQGVEEWLGRRSWCVLVYVSY